MAPKNINSPPAGPPVPLQLRPTPAAVFEPKKIGRSWYNPFLYLQHLLFSRFSQSNERAKAENATKSIAAVPSPEQTGGIWESAPESNVHNCQAKAFAGAFPTKSVEQFWLGFCRFWARQVPFLGEYANLLQFSRRNLWLHLAQMQCKKRRLYEDEAGEDMFCVGMDSKGQEWWHKVALTGRLHARPNLLPVAVHPFKLWIGQVQKKLKEIILLFIYQTPQLYCPFYAKKTLPNWRLKNIKMY